MSAICLNSLIAFKLWRRFKESRIRVVAILTGAYLLFILFICIELIFLLLNFVDPISFYFKEGNVVVFLFPFFGGISAGFFMLFIDYFENERSPPIHTAIYGAFLGTFLLNVIYSLIIPELFSQGDLIVIPEETLDISVIILVILDFLFSSNFPASYFIIYVIFVTLRSLQRIKGKQEEAQKKQVLFMQWAIVFYYLVTMVLVVMGFQLTNIIDPSIIVFLKHFAPQLSVVVGGILMFQVYVKAPIGFLQFQPLEKIMVINRSGLLLYSYDFGLTGDNENSQDVLFSGGVYAVLTLFSDMIKTKNIQMIHFQNKIIMLSHNESFVVFLVVDRVTSFLWSALESFSTIFNLKYGLETLQYSVVPKNVFIDTEQLVNVAFGLQ
ncbi:MAG: hypothetical protein JSV04_12365 [Candidatus Heimdallarchaeota archaeon]|nr:MAG: hypothetical protein JSV04_12365 [Candidatus Heimdallarchaeota archaeon]